MAGRIDLGERWRVLVVGNNPIDLNYIFDRLKGISKKHILTEMAFDLRSALQRLLTFHPEHILIDDNVGRPAMKAMVLELQKSDSRYVPITVLKNSNYQESIGTGVMNYVLKDNLNSELLYKELLNSLHFLRTHLSWEQAHRKKAGALKRLLGSGDQI